MLVDLKTLDGNWAHEGRSEALCYAIGQSMEPVHAMLLLRTHEKNEENMAASRQVELLKVAVVLRDLHGLLEIRTHLWPKPRLPRAVGVKDIHPRPSP